MYLYGFGNSNKICPVYTVWPLYSLLLSTFYPSVKNGLISFSGKYIYSSFIMLSTNQCFGKRGLKPICETWKNKNPPWI